MKTEDYLYLFDITTDYGPREAEGRSMLFMRIHEVGALAALDDVSKSPEFLQAAGSSALKVGNGVTSIVEDPEATAKGIGGGYKRSGANLGRKMKRTGDEVTNSDESSSGTAANATTGIAYSVLGVNAGARKWAHNVNAGPYTTNPILKKALTDLGKIDAAGGRLPRRSWSRSRWWSVRRRR